MHSANAVTPQNALSVAILVRNEVLRKGLEAVLRTSSVVETVTRYVPGMLGRIASGSAPDFVIVAAADVDELPIGEVGKAPRPKVLVILGDTTAADAMRCAKLGADGYLAQGDLSGATLHDALRRAVADEVPMPPALSRALLARADAPARFGRSEPAYLTDREIEALGLLVRGMSNKQIARGLGISNHGAKRLVSSILLKLDSPNRTSAVVNAIKAGLVESSEPDETNDEVTQR